ncbi:restriction endonuclease subunit S [Paenalcaligenes hominis]|uniref:restriction endonuclease subunit S n=1 Tax=Paenalcaligenes hominis TaxID=643674 RepID=UPI003525F04D
MSSSFQKVKFLDVVQIITERIPVRDAKVSTYISTDNMIGNLGGVTEASQLPKSGSVTTFNENDVLFSNIRTYFRKVWLADHAGSCSPDVLVFRTRSPKVLDQRYLHWIVCSQDFIKYTDLTAKGAKMPRGDKNAIGLYKLKLPELSKQKGIATVLDNIAQKITNNSQINQTLEQIAQALFKSWFVDFDPVKAKIEVLEAGGSEEEALIAAMQVISSKSAEELAVFEVER